MKYGIEFNMSGILVMVCAVAIAVIGFATSPVAVAISAVVALLGASLLIRPKGTAEPQLRHFVDPASYSAR